MPSFDEKDLKIMQALNGNGPRTSTEQLSQNLNIPPRTIRYRISKLKEKGIMKPYVITTHERKIGMGDNLIILNINNEKEDLFLKLINVIPYIYTYTSTYGKYNGYSMRSVYSLGEPQTNYEILEIMKKSDYILDYYIFDVVDYQIKNLDFKYYDPKKGWIWDWNKWYDDIKTCLKIKDLKLNLNFELDADVVDFDYDDILLLKNLVSDASITHKQLKETLDLSEPSINKRIQNLVDKRIIRDYYIDFDLTHSEDYINFYCFIECNEKIKNILSCFYQIPYYIMILIESTNKFCFQMRLNANDLRKFLTGFDLLRPHLQSYFFQFLHKKIKENPQYLFDFYNRITKTWETPIEDYISLIEKD